ncbi:RNA-directed DNA polymerase, eukaryota, reverse transcriptase zinc-binding domain protein [Tanacetum coccineum]
MKDCFKRAWSADREKENGELDRMEGIMEDVLDDESVRNITTNKIKGSCSSLIVMGWNTGAVRLMVLNEYKQHLLCRIENIHDYRKMYFSFVYASNSGIERRIMWDELQIAKTYINGSPWILMGDFNVTLSLSEHIAGKSTIDNDMNEFIDCMNTIEVEDVCKTGMHYTWIKSPSKPHTSIMKKLDRIMANEQLLDEYNQAYAIFHPFLVSDHSSAVIILPQAMYRKKNSFKFTNFMADKEEFSSIVKKGWSNKGDNVVTEFVRHFEEFLGKADNVNPLDNLDNIFTNKLTNEEALYMTHEVTDREVKDVMCGINDSKATGPDSKGFFANGGENPNFKYHAGCKEIKLTHLCFANDLLVMCHGNVDSVMVVKEALDIFSSVFGLKPNMRKSTIFFGNIDVGEKRKILDIMPFQEGRFPMRYLGAPLINKRLGRNNCKQLIDKVKNRIADWKNIFLSYARRVQLIASVLGSMQLYWASVFLLPKSTMKDIEIILKGFLWTQGDKARAAKKDTLWVQWIHMIKLKRRSLWVIDTKVSDSWIWKVLLGLRDKARKHIEQRIGNGENTSVWFDKWCEIGPLSDYITSRDLYDARYEHDASVASMISNAIWRDNNKQIKKFSIKQVWDDYKINGPKVNWGNLVWFTQSIPNHMFIVWLDIHGRLIWKALKLKVHDANVPNDWHSFVNYLASIGRNKSIRVILKKIVFGAAVYFIWQERNRRLFTSVKREVIDLLEAILEVIKLRLVSIRVTNIQNVMEVAKELDIKFRNVLRKTKP